MKFPISSDSLNELQDPPSPKTRTHNDQFQSGKKKQGNLKLYEIDKSILHDHKQHHNQHLHSDR